MASSSGNIFRVTCPCVGNSLLTGEFPSQRPVTQNFNVFFDLRLDKRLSKQPRYRWFETLSCSLWCHYIAFACQEHVITTCLLMTIIYKYEQDILRGQLKITVLNSIANDTTKNVFLHKALEYHNDSYSMVLCGSLPTVHDQHFFGY